MAKGSKKAPRGVRWETVRRLTLSFPGMSEGTSYGAHAFLLDGKFFSRFHVKAQGLVIPVADPLRDALLEGRAETYFTTDHYRGYPYVLARLERLPRAELAALLEAAFRAKAKRARVAEWEASRRREGDLSRGREGEASRGRGATPRGKGRRASLRSAARGTRSAARGTTLARTTARRKTPR